MDEVEVFFDDCYNDHLDVVMTRLQADSNLVRSRRIGNRTPLHQAAFGGAHRVVALLIDRGADVNARTEFDWVPLHYAAASESGKIAELLIDNGANLDIANDDGLTPLHFAVDFGNVQMVRLLLAGGANVNTRDREGRTPLDCAPTDSPIRDLLQKLGATKGRDPVQAKPEDKLPDWLAGNEQAIEELKDTLNAQWSRKSVKNAGED